MKVREILVVEAIKRGLDNAYAGDSNDIARSIYINMKLEGFTVKLPEHVPYKGYKPSYCDRSD